MFEKVRLLLGEYSQGKPGPCEPDSVERASAELETAEEYQQFLVGALENARQLAADERTGKADRWRKEWRDVAEARKRDRIRHDAVEEHRARGMSKEAAAAAVAEAEGLSDSRVVSDAHSRHQIRCPRCCEELQLVKFPEHGLVAVCHICNTDCPPPDRLVKLAENCAPRDPEWLRIQADLEETEQRLADPRVSGPTRTRLRGEQRTLKRRLTRWVEIYKGRLEDFL